MSILNHVPSGWELRPEQRDLLMAIEAGWDRHDVIAGLLPTAFGKTLIAVTLANWRAASKDNVSYIIPDNILVEQVQSQFPNLVALHRKDRYHCDTWGTDCAHSHRKQDGYCKGCPYLGAKRAATKATIRVANYYVYYAHRLHSRVLIADEAHRLVNMLEDKKDIKIWRKDFNFPPGLRTVADVVEWAQGCLKAADNHKLELALKEVLHIREGAIVEYRQGFRHGKAEEVLTIIPADTRAVPSWLWPQNKVRKIVLLSATIGAQDIAELGLNHRRVLYLSCPSPIPATNRPVLYEPRCNMARRFRDKALPHFVKAVQEKLAVHPEKGLIHLPYSVAESFSELCFDPRLMFHTHNNKAEVLARFRESPPEQGRVLVASGLYEGLDLPFDAARWQVIGCVPWANLGDDRTKRKAATNPDWFSWGAIKKVLQAAGRIVRSPTDYGCTYIFDSNFERLYNQDKQRKQPMFPSFFRDAVKGKGLRQ